MEPKIDVPSPRNPGDLPFDELFLAYRDEPDFAYDLALESLEQLEGSSGTEEEIFECLLEDIIFSSLYATYYEQVLTALRNEPGRGGELIGRFSEERSSRERFIAVQTGAHADFIRQGGRCEGCPFCENHGDVQGLVERWIRRDYGFLSGFYVGMVTIRHSMEQILYDIVPVRADLVALFTEENILDYRRRIIGYTDEHFF